MSITIRNGDWVVVCDGRKALLFENEGDETYPNFKTRDVEQQPDEPTHELGTDRPGRFEEMATGERSAAESTDFHDLAETAFLKDLSKRLDALVRAGQIRHLIVVAPPRALGAIRKTYTSALQQAIRAEVDHDLVKLPVAEIEQRLAKSLRSA